MTGSTLPRPKGVLLDDGGTQAVWLRAPNAQRWSLADLTVRDWAKLQAWFEQTTVSAA